ncbi:MAG: hypothetical protein KDA36_07385 [Planctomycetaceae bacterium]|nr:hypothetical protein [Planctomycetaceae bacterium]
MRHVTVLWDRVGDEDERAVGICVFTTAPVSLAGRRKFFGLQGKWTKLGLKALNEQVVLLSRVVLHPTYRGVGIGAEFIRRSCESCGWGWVETLTELGRRNPVFERAGFVRVPTEAKGRRDRAGHSAIYGTRRGGYGKKRLVSEETFEKSRFSNPAYYIFDNRGNVGSRRGGR